MKDLLNFQSPLPCWNSFKWHKERVIGEWSVQKAAKVYVILIDCCRELDMKKCVNVWLLASL